MHVPWENRLRLTLRSRLSWSPPRTEFHMSGLQKRKIKGSLWKSLSVSRSLSGHLPLSLWFRSCSREAMLLHFNGKLKPWRSRRWVGDSEICSSFAQIFVREELDRIGNHLATVWQPFSSLNCLNFEVRKQPSPMCLVKATTFPTLQRKNVNGMDFVRCADIWTGPWANAMVTQHDDMMIQSSRFQPNHMMPFGLEWF